LANWLIRKPSLRIRILLSGSIVFSARKTLLSRYPLQLLAARWLAVGFSLLSGLREKVALRLAFCDMVIDWQSLLEQAEQSKYQCPGISFPHYFVTLQDQRLSVNGMPKHNAIFVISNPENTMKHIQLYPNITRNNYIICLSYTAYDHPFEITSATEAGILPAIITEDNDPQGSGGDFPNGILTALPYTLGYFKVPIYPVEDPFKTTNNSDPYQLEIYPNPSAITIQVMHNGISVNFDELLQITILDMEGDMIQTTQINLNETLDNSHLAAGCYLIKITDKNQTSYNKKLIKTK